MTYLVGSRSLVPGRANLLQRPVPAQFGPSVVLTLGVSQTLALPSKCRIFKVLATGTVAYFRFGTSSSVVTLPFDGSFDDFAPPDVEVFIGVPPKSTHVAYAGAAAGTAAVAFF
ncbi:MAG: hypothetical protein NZ518_01600 [Dehalococcoidia bacterium]|nr:hypothetical protein [Dehalococcoidia bacterium]